MDRNTEIKRELFKIWVEEAEMEKGDKFRCNQTNRNGIIRDVYDWILYFQFENSAIQSTENVEDFYFLKFPSYEEQRDEIKNQKNKIEELEKEIERLKKEASEPTPTTEPEITPKRVELIETEKPKMSDIQKEMSKQIEKSKAQFLKNKGKREAEVKKATEALTIKEIKPTKKRTKKGVNQTQEVYNFFFNTKKSQPIRSVIGKTKIPQGTCARIVKGLHNAGLIKKLGTGACTSYYQEGEDRSAELENKFVNYKSEIVEIK